MHPSGKHAGTTLVVSKVSVEILSIRISFVTFSMDAVFSL
jgi:hypothetical protein